jgi:hypothetical protein
VVYIFGIFIILHGLVHLLYFGQSQKLFELQPRMVWPEGSWIFSRLYEHQPPKWVSGIIFTLSAVTFILAAILFIAGGAGLILGQPWWRPTVMSAAIFSSIIIILFWDGQRSTWKAQGGIGFLINLAILASVIILFQPNPG